MPAKTLRRVEAVLCPWNAAASGYEIHNGLSTLEAPLPALLRSAAPVDAGVMSADGQVAGCYLHGVFDHPEACSALLRWAGLQEPVAIDRAALRERELDRLADSLEAHLDLASLFPQWPAR